ncbi:MAG: hypothetical protein ACI89D_001548 [Bermanella sp.]
MEKLMYLLDRANSPGALQQNLSSDIIPALQKTGASNIVLNMADLDKAISAAAPQRIAGNWQDLGAVVSLWVDSVDGHKELETILSKSGCELAGYLVTESVPQAYEQNWKPNERRPGLTQFTAHGKPEHIGERAFYRNWGEHTELSFKLHPLRWSYVRNAVVRSLSDSAPSYRALVMEHFREANDFTDECRYFGDPATVQKMYEELPGFCDFGSMMTGAMSEYQY